MRIARWFVVSALLAVLGLSGCATSPPSGSVAAAPKAEAKPSGVASVTGAIGGGFKAAANWMTPKATVIPAKDPTSLAVKPPKPGADICVSMARVHESRNQVDQAAQQYETALSIDAKYEPALLGYARLLDRQSKFEAATVYYERAVAAHPKSAGSHNDLGLCFARRGMFPKAAEELRLAINLEPQRPLYRNNLANVLVEMQREDEALRELLVVLDPASARYNMGVMLHQAKQPDRAAIHFAEAARLNPSLQAAHVWLAQLTAQRANSVVAQAEAPAARPQLTAQPVSAQSEIDSAVQSTVPRRDPRRYDNSVAPEPPTSSGPRISSPMRLPSPTRPAQAEPENAPLPIS